MKRPSRKMIGLLVLLLAAIGIGAMMIARKHHALAQAPRYTLDPVPVRVATAEQGALTVTRPYVATVEPVRRAELSARLTADVREVRWTEGDRVAQGETGIFLDDRDLNRQLAAAEARIAEAQSEGESRKSHLATVQRSVAFWEAEAGRIRVLADDNHVSPSEAAAMEERLNEAQGQVRVTEHQIGALGSRTESLRANRDEIAARLAFAQLAAPFDGVVTKRFVDPGDLAVPGKVLLVIEETSALRLAFDMPQSDLAEVREGMDVVVSAADGEHRLSVTTIHPALQENRTVRVWIDVNEALRDRVKVGQFVSVALTLSTLDTATIVPRSSLVERSGDEPFVYLVDANHLAVRPVTVLGKEGDRVAVTGVEPGAQVVRYTYMDWARISEGRRVVVWP